MIHLSIVHIISIILTLSLVSCVGIYAGRQVKNASDFSVGGRKAGVWLVAGTIMGTFVGGASTIGTAELAFRFGISAWWFTLGGGISCLIMGLFLARPLRESGLETIPQFLVTKYGPPVGPITSIFSSIGIFLSIISQILAATALLSSMFQLSPILGALVSIGLVIIYVFFGGVMGTGVLGIAKLLLLYFSLIVVGWLSYAKLGGVTGLISSFPAFPWFSFFGRGYSVDLAAAFSLIVGVLSTQTYVQAIFAGRDARASRYGALVSAFFIPLSGVAGVLVGMHMKLSFPDMSAAQALPVFALIYLPPWLGGIVLATLLVAVIGTAAGLTLGISTMFTNDIFKKYISPQASDHQVLRVSRGILVIVVTLTLFFVTGNLKSMILQWSFLSMGLRGATIFLPLLGGIFFHKYISPKGGLLALIAGPVADLAWKLYYPQGIDPLYIGLLASLICLILGSALFPVSKDRRYTKA